MTRPPRPTMTTCRRLLGALTTAGLGLMLAAAGGCRSKQPSAREVLEAMAKAYHFASSYADAGTVRLQAEVGGEKIDQSADFSVTLMRPNKLRGQLYNAMVVCDGEKMYAAVNADEVEDQVLVQDAPAELTSDSLDSDAYLADAMTYEFAVASPQLTLFLHKEPLTSLLEGAAEPVFGEPGEIEGHRCFCVQVKWPHVAGEFWIDQQSHVLRRIVYRTDSFWKRQSKRGPVKGLSLVADFTGAQLDGQIDPQAFRFEVPARARFVKCLIPPAPEQLLGKKGGDFQFFNLEGKPVTSASLVGKIAVLAFWRTYDCQPCRKGLPLLEAVYQRYKDNPRVVFYAVSVDEPKIDDQALRDTFEQLEVHFPILRDPNQDLANVLKAKAIPCMFILDGKGVVQDYDPWPNPDLNTELPQKLEKLLLGRDIYQKRLEEYHQKLKDTYGWTPEEPAKTGTTGQPMVQEHELPQVRVAPASKPQTLRLTSLWKCTELKAPGNVLVVGAPGASARLLVIEGRKAVVEIGLDGKVIATHRLGIDEEREQVTQLRTAAAADGKRYFAALAGGQQRFHLFDEKWKKLFSFPEDALENTHAGIADVEFGDLDGDGTPELYVGYLGVVGVQAVSLQGQRQYSNRDINLVLRMAAGDIDQGHRRLFCVNTTGSLAMLDAELQRRGDVLVPGRPLQQIVAADLGGNGQLQWCGLTAPKLGDNVAIGLNLRGEELWNYALPTGFQDQPIELIIPGKVTASLPGQWLLPGADGSIHILGADGKPIDRFNYGSVLCGLATAEVDGRPVLVVASPQGIEALRVE